MAMRLNVTGLASGLLQGRGGSWPTFSGGAATAGTGPTSIVAVALKDTSGSGATVRLRDGGAGPNSEIVMTFVLGNNAAVRESYPDGYFNLYSDELYFELASGAVEGSIVVT